MFVCLCVRVCVRIRVCVCVRVCVCGVYTYIAATQTAAVATASALGDAGEAAL